jgi:carboxyl-terminal processing protease
MKSLQKTFLALTALLGAFYLSISYHYGDPGWRLRFDPAPAAEANSGVVAGYDLGSLSILNRAVIHLKENYVDPSRINERRMLGAAMEEVQRAIAELLVEVERDADGIPTRLTVRIGDQSRPFDLTDVGNLWQMSFKFKDMFRFIGDNLRHHTRLQDIEYAAINGMLSTLDPHSVLLRPEDYREMKLSTRGKFGGLGIVISIRDGQLTIVNPMDDTPASRAGLLAGDRIVQIGLDSTVNMALSDAVDLLRGEPGTPADLWVLREGWKKARKYTLTRADIKVESVASTLLDGNVGLVRLRNFQNTTHDELQAALGALRKKARGGLAGLVLDLRGNPGGLLDQAIKIADLFVSSGPLVTTVGFGDRMREPKMATRAGTETDLPVVVLTDAHSASASEIVAGALKNHHRALIVGQRTFGKGSVQVIYDNKDDSALKLTIAQYLTPGDLSIQSVGITPDIETRAVVITEERTDLFLTETEMSGEVSLPAHLDHERAEVSRGEAPALVVEYLRDEALHAKIEANPEDLIVDAEIALARDLLQATRAHDRETMLKDARAVIDARTAAEAVRIADALTARGVDWRADEPGPVTAANPGRGKPRAEVTVRTITPAADRLTAGETLRIEATVRNTGDAPFTRLHAITASANELLAGHELIFGRVPPGESRTWTVDVELPKSALTRRDVVTLAFADTSGTPVADAQLKVDVQQLARPRFALHWRVDDRAAGNGDGLLQLGEEAELVVLAKNLGPGASFKILGTLRNDETDLERGVYLKQARVEHDSLAPGESATMRLSFKVKVARPGAVPVMVGVYDSEIRESTTEKAMLTVVGPDETVAPAAISLVGTGGRVALRGVPHDTAPIVATTAGTARADGRFGDWYRVPLADGVGWVPAAEVQPAPALALPDSPPVAAVDPTGPPLIELNREPLAVETRDHALTLDGAVSGPRQVRDMLIYVNNKKVYFKSNAGLLGDPFKFSAQVPLDEGTNRITLIAREDEDQASRRTVIVHRTP